MSQPAPGDGQAPNTEPANEGQAPPEANKGESEVAELRREAARYRTALRKAEADLAAHKSAQMTEQERAVAAARDEGAATFKGKWKEAVVTNAALALLAEKGVTATDLAVRALDLRGIDVNDDGQFDHGQIKSAVDELVTRYPMLASHQQSSAPSVTSATGDGQQRISRESVLSAAKQSEDQALNDALRYALGRRPR